VQKINCAIAICEFSVILRDDGQKNLKTSMNFPNLIRRPACLGLAVAFGALVLPLNADVVELTNGDRYQGKVVSMTEGFLDFQSEIQGRVKLPRDKVATITLHGSAAPKPVSKTVTAAPIAAPLILSGTNHASVPAGSADAVVEQMRREGIDPKTIKQVQEQIFGQSSPEAAQKFNQTMAGLLSGQLTVGDIRVQAENSIKQIKEAKKDLGGDEGDMLDGYLAILEQFVQQTGTAETISPLPRAAQPEPDSALTPAK
jgi:hypothetical protein